MTQSGQRSTAYDSKWTKIHGASGNRTAGLPLSLWLPSPLGQRGGVEEEEVVVEEEGGRRSRRGGRKKKKKRREEEEVEEEEEVVEEEGGRRSRRGGRSSRRGGGSSSSRRGGGGRRSSRRRGGRRSSRRGEGRSRRGGRRSSRRGRRRITFFEPLQCQKRSQSLFGNRETHRRLFTPAVFQYNMAQPTELCTGQNNPMHFPIENLGCDL